MADASVGCHRISATPATSRKTPLGEVQHRHRPPASLALQHPELAAEVGDRDRAEREQAGREQAVEAQQPVDRRGGEQQQTTHHQGGAQRQAQHLPLDLPHVLGVRGDPTRGRGLDAELEHGHHDEHGHQGGERAVLPRAEQARRDGGEDVEGEVHAAHRDGDDCASVADALPGARWTTSPGERSRAGSSPSPRGRVPRGAAAAGPGSRATVRDVSTPAPVRSPDRILEAVIEGLLAVDVPEVDGTILRAAASAAAVQAGGMPDLTRLGVRLVGTLVVAVCLLPARGHLARLPAETPRPLGDQAGTLPPHR